MTRENVPVSEAQQTGKPGRYNRSTGGLIGSMIVLVLVVLGIVIFRGAFRDTPDYEPEPVDYLELVSGLQQAGLSPAYPASLPDGWYVKDLRYEPGEQPTLDIAMVTDDEKFAGIHESAQEVDDLIAELVGTEAVEGDEVQIEGSVAPTWQTFSDPDGDHAFAAEVGGQTVLVYGDAGEDELRDLTASLTTEPITP